MPLKIVYLDDEPMLCEMFVDNFASSEVLVRAFTDPETAIQVINETTPHLVVLDYRLPWTNGQEVAERLDPAIPKVLVTGDLNVNGSKSFVKVFHKPFNFTEMEALIRMYSEKIMCLRINSRYLQGKLSLKMAFGSYCLRH